MNEPKHEYIGPARINLDIFRRGILITISSVNLGVYMTPDEAIEFAKAMIKTAEYLKKRDHVQ